MAARIIQTFTGFSGSAVYLMQKHQQVFVRKCRNVHRNHERLLYLRGRVPVPKIYGLHGEMLDIEYVHGTDMRTWLISNPAKPVLDFLRQSLDELYRHHESQDRQSQHREFVARLPVWPFAFSREEFVSRLPRQVPASDYIGDLTLENIIATQDGFVFIDCQTTEWNSIIYDIAKLQQDLDCGWFLRAKPAMLENKLTYIQRGLFEQWPEANNPALTALMLMRVLRYCNPDRPEHEFLIKEINRLCK